MTQGYYLLNFGVWITFLFLMLIDMKQFMVLLDFADCIRVQLHEFFLRTVPDKSIYSYLTTSGFSVIAFLSGNTLINSVKYNNQVKELKKILSSLIENQVSSIKLMQESLITIKSLLREFYPILSGQQQAETEREKNMVRNFWSNVSLVKRRIAKVEKDNLYEKVLIDRKSLKADPSIMVDDYFNTLRVLLINLETLVFSNFPDSGKEENFQWRKVNLISNFLDEHITDLGVLICKAEMCKIVLVENKICNIILVENKDNKESLVSSFYKLISPNNGLFNYYRRELIPLDELEKIDQFIHKKCQKQKLKYCDFSELIQSARTKIKLYAEEANDPLRFLIQSKSIH